MALRQKPPLLWQEAPAKAMAMVFPASVSSCIALSISIFAGLLQNMMVSPVCFIPVLKLYLILVINNTG